MMTYNKGQHCTYLLTYHFVFVVKWRKPVIDDTITAFMKQHAAYLLQKRGGDLVSLESDRDHIHLMASLPPNMNLSNTVRSLKTQLSKEIHARFPDRLSEFFRGNEPFWSESYFVATTGTVSMEKVKEYIESQRTSEHQIKRRRKRSSSRQ